MKWQIGLLLGVLSCSSSIVHAQWYAAADFVAMTRTSSVDAVYQRDQADELDGDGNPTGSFLIGSSSLLQAGDLDLGLVAGGRVTAGYRSDVYGLEGCYMLADEWTSAASVESTALPTDLSGLMASPFSKPGSTVDPTSPWDSNYSATVAYATQMESGEVHLTTMAYASEYGQAWLLCGARFMSISESLAYVSSNAIADISVLTDVDNRLVGPQVGLQVESIVPGGFLDLDLKFALAYNTIDKTTVYNGLPGAGDDGTGSALFEFGVKYRVQPCRNLAVHIGYRLVSLDGIALATDNFESNLAVLSSGNATVETDRAVYHAPYVGVVFSR